MTTLREAAQQGLGALKCLVETYEMGNTIRADIMDAEEAITAIETALEQPEQEPVAWSTRERFYEALDRAVGNVRQEMRIKTVTMRRKDHDIALPIIDAYSGHVLVGDPPRREWRSLSEEEILPLYSMLPSSHAEMLEFARDIEAALRSKNHE
jgi:hypothetical protein